MHAIHLTTHDGQIQMLCLPQVSAIIDAHVVDGHLYHVLNRGNYRLEVFAVGQPVAAESTRPGSEETPSVEKTPQMSLITA